MFVGDVDADDFAENVCSIKDNNLILKNRNLVALSDLIRFAVLYKYPGIYTDGDTIYLKDMRFLWYVNFAYRWSHLNSYNTAVIGFNKDLNPSINNLLNVVIKNSTIEGLIFGFHPQLVSTFIVSLNSLKTTFDFDLLLNLHLYFFDAAWLCHDGIMSRLKKSDVCKFLEFSNSVLTDQFDPIEFFKGAYAYHIHYKGNDITENSYFYYFEKYYLKFLGNLNDKFYEQYHVLNK